MGKRVERRRNGVGRHEWRQSGALKVLQHAFDSEGHRPNDGYHRPGSSKKA
jgi:hypothetical protein